MAKDDRIERWRRTIDDFGDPIFGLADAPTHKWGGSGNNEWGQTVSTGYRSGDKLIIVETGEGCDELWETRNVYSVLTHDGEVTFPLTITVEKATVVWDVDGVAIEARLLYTPTRWIAGARVGDRFVQVTGIGVPFESLRLRGLTTGEVLFP